MRNLKINIDLIKTLDPCKESLENAMKYYKNKEVNVKQFMGLKHISHKDKVWVAFKLMNPKHIRFAAADIAELVLPLYEKAYPLDLRPRKAIEAARNTLKFKASNALAACDVAHGAAHAARAAADAAVYAADAAAYAAARAASRVAYAAAYAADAVALASDAAYAASYAAAYAAAHATEAAVYAAAHAADAAAYAQENYQKKIRTILIKYLNIRR